MTKQIKQVATTEDYIVARYEDDSIGVYNRYGNTKGALREIAEAQGFEYDPTWTTRQFGKKLIDALGNGAAIADNDYIVYIDANNIIVCGEKFEGDTKEGLRTIAKKYNIPYEKGWNTHQLGRKIIEHLLSVRFHIEEFLRENTKLFYNERDLQVNLALFLKNKGYYKNVFLEYSLPTKMLYPNSKSSADVRIDIVVEKNGKFIPIELKYKTEKVTGELHRFGEKPLGTILKKQGAQNIGKYSFWKDIERIERIKENFKNVQTGYCVFITNDKSYTQPSGGATAPFSMEAGATRMGNLDWDGDVELANRLSTISLKEKHTIKKWDTAENEGITFHYCIVEV
nr:hypothetical protein [uncultured Capnocytophaga sp.]